MGSSAGKEQELKIKILSGETQSQELFDFHSPQKQQSISELAFPSIVGFTDQGDIVYLPEQKAEAGIQPLYRIQRKNIRDIVIRELFERSKQYEQSYMWKVLGEGQQMQLQVGDSIKIGKTKIVFKQIVVGNTLNKQSAMMVSDKQQTSRMDLSNTMEMPTKMHDGQEGQCRICFDHTETPGNPLVCLCKCSGSVKFVHYQCLKDWVSNNVKRDKSSNCYFYSYSEPNCCQLCKQPLQNQFRYEGQKYQLYQFQKFEPPFAVFENRFFDQQSNKTRVSVYTISLPQNTEVTIGRNHNSQVILRDISVSRKHCFLTYKQGGLYIQDKKSKFGTLVCPKKGFEFDSVHGLQLQYQSKVIQISQQKAFNNCCCAQNYSYFVEINRGTNE